LLLKILCFEFFVLVKKIMGYSCMLQAIATTTDGSNVPPDTLAFYRDILNTLNNASLPFMVGGAYALYHYTGIDRLTKDFDIFIAHEDYSAISRVLTAAGYKMDLAYPHWLAKVYDSGEFIDLIFSSGNGIATVDKSWFEHAPVAQIFDVDAKICPVEEMIWSKAFVMERERFDGADVAHLILAQGRQLNWRRLMVRFDPHWRLLLSHLTLFGLIYPVHRQIIPEFVMHELLERLNDEIRSAPPAEKICGGTLLSREQYLNDIGPRGYQDARVIPFGNMTEQAAAQWTAAIFHNKKH
jgi:hypothetical protein